MIDLSKIITTGNCEFSCKSLIGSISVTESSNINKTYNGEIILTETAQLTCFGTCEKLTAAAQGVSTPCPNALAAVPWTPESTETSIKINGISVLNHMAKKICPVGDVVSCTIKSQNNKLTKEIKIESPFFCNLTSYSSQTAVKLTLPIEPFVILDILTSPCLHSTKSAFI